MDDKTNINDLVAKRILGVATPEEERQLDNSLDNTPGLREKVEEMLNNKNAAKEVQDTDSPEAILVTHHDKEFWMVLDDGIHVHLNYNSSLSYPIHFKGKERRVVLEGEAYFFVAKDDSHPFVVTTPYGDIRDYGTEFCVNTKPRQGGASVVLVKGKKRENMKHLLTSKRAFCSLLFALCAIAPWTIEATAQRSPNVTIKMTSATVKNFSPS